MITAQQVVYDADADSSFYIAEQQAAGFVVRIPGPHELQVDLDSDEHSAVYARSIEILRRKVPNLKERETVSRNGRRHIHIELPFPVDAWERIAWQAALGSDPVRELLSCLRIVNGDAVPSMLVETKEAAAMLDPKPEEFAF